jgi:hypothetical protein
MRSLAALAGAAAIAWSTGASAQAYCWLSRTSLCGGCTATIHGKVVVSSVPRPAIPGGSSDRTWCALTGTSSGGSWRPPEILQAPSLGELRVRNATSLLYKSDRVGRDRFTVRIHWTDRMGQQQSTVVDHEIEVVGAPM